MGSNIPGVTLFIFFIIILGFSLSKAETVPAMYVFGDSLVDVGNNNYLIDSLTKADFPYNGVDYPGHIPTGRFSNGKNAADLLAEKVGLGTSQPYLSLVYKSNRNNAFVAGVSFASGGAGILNGTDLLFGQSIPLATQVQIYSRVYESLVQQLGSGGAHMHLSKSLFTIVIGSNDISDYFSSGSNLPKNTPPQQFVNLMLSSLKPLLKRLHDLGARKYVITGIPPVGCCPSQRINIKSGECNEAANYWSSNYNNGLKSLLQELKSEFNDINYSYFDSYTALTNFIQNPPTYGFSEVKAACCGRGKLKAQVPCVPISTYCSNRSDHLFWDLFHPTERATRFLVDFLFSGSQQYVIPINVKQLVAV